MNTQIRCLFWGFLFCVGQIVAQPFGAERVFAKTLQSFAQEVPALFSVPLSLPFLPSLTPEKVNWEAAKKTLDTGLDLYVVSLRENAESDLVVLSISPEQYVFDLHMASEEGRSFSLYDWAEKYNLIAAINASMFLPDNVTSIGHMQSATHRNNDKVGSQLGGFFLADPLEEDNESAPKPNAEVLDKEEPDWEHRLAQYSIRIQNLRILNRNQDIIWSKDLRRYSIAAIGKAESGNILFVMSQEALTVQLLAQYLLASPLQIVSLMYVEGGDKAGMIVRQESSPQLWQGKTSVFESKGNPATLIPNILGVRKRL